MRNIVNTNTIYLYIHEHGITKTKFCEMCKISLSTLNKVLNGEVNVRVDILFKIAKVLQIEIHEMFN